MKLDFTLEDLQATRFINSYKRLIKQATKFTEFSEEEATFILVAYYKFALINKNSKFITKSQMLTILEVLFNLYDRMINERIVEVIEPESKGMIKPESWLKLFDVYLSESVEKKMQLCFKVYDLNNSGMVERVECVQRLVENFIITDDDDIREEIQMDWTDLIMARMDPDKDGKISYADYTESVAKRPIMMQCLGLVIPNTEVARELFPLRSRSKEGTGIKKKRKFKSRPPPPPPPVEEPPPAEPAPTGKKGKSKGKENVPPPSAAPKQKKK